MYDFIFYYLFRSDLMCYNYLYNINYLYNVMNIKYNLKQDAFCCYCVCI